MTEDTTQPNIPRDYSGIEVVDHPERVYASKAFWAGIALTVSGFAFGLAVFGG